MCQTESRLAGKQSWHKVYNMLSITNVSWVLTATWVSWFFAVFQKVISLSAVVFFFFSVFNVRGTSYSSVENQQVQDTCTVCLRGYFCETRTNSDRHGFLLASIHIFSCVYMRLV